MAENRLTKVIEGKLYFAWTKGKFPTKFTSRKSADKVADKLRGFHQNARVIKYKGYYKVFYRGKDIKI